MTPEQELRQFIMIGRRAGTSAGGASRLGKALRILGAVIAAMLALVMLAVLGLRVLVYSDWAAENGIAQTVSAYAVGLTEDDWAAYRAAVQASRD